MKRLSVEGESERGRRERGREGGERRQERMRKAGREGALSSKML